MKRFSPYSGASEGLSFDEPSRAVQSEKESTLISSILKRFAATGVLPSVGRVALPADILLGGDDFQSLNERLDRARRSGVSEEVISHEASNASVPVEQSSQSPLGASSESVQGVGGTPSGQG